MDFIPKFCPRRIVSGDKSAFIDWNWENIAPEPNYGCFEAQLSRQSNDN